MSDIAKIDEAVLTIIDTAGIQDYIFGSNRLRENIGASFLVEQATRDWVYEELDKLGKHNIANLEINRNKKMENAADDLSAELIYAGGGNTAILFRSMGEAKIFAWKLSKRVLREAPGLEIVIAHSSKPFPWQHDARDLPGKVKDLRDGRLAQKKRTRQTTPTQLLGLSVTAECTSTGLVATQISRELEAEPRLISREIVAKLEATHKDKPDGQIRNEAKKRLLNYLRETGQNFNADEFEFSDELDHLGRTSGEESYIAVVHVDGNSMGEVIKDYVANTKDNREYIERLRDFSAGVERASKAALVKTLCTLRSHIKDERDPETNRKIWQVNEAIPTPLIVPKDKLTTTQQKRIQLFEEDKNGKPCWPFRPLVFGGDDVTFVCNGQLGLSLATIFMDAVTAETRELMKDSPHKEIHTGAGVCIVKVHYPFRRAYELSAQLTEQAKLLLGHKKREASALDWHISTTGLSGRLNTIRKQEYKVRGDQCLTMRPVWLDHQSEWRIWENFNRFVAAFNYDNRWAGRRNKLKALREVLRNGEEAVQEYLGVTKFPGGERDLQSDGDAALPEVINDQGRLLRLRGWENKRCVYFDALEAMDHHFLLEEVKDDKAG